jgi:hypothetical protein
MRLRTLGAIVAGTLAATMASAGPALAAGPVLAKGTVLAKSTGGAQPATWTVVPSANHTGPNYIGGISCPSAASCTMVGDYGNTVLRSLIEVGDGTSWAIVPSPNKYLDNVLDGVSCSSADACVAVGASNPKAGKAKTLIEVWDGASWSVVPSPDPAAGQGIDLLRGVSCSSATACVAVGEYAKPASPVERPKTLVETWDGTTWSVTPSPVSGVQGSLYGVSCLSASACTAVGSWADKHGKSKALIESWNGTRWSIVANPSPLSIGTVVLTGVSCPAADACEAVGHDAGNSEYATNLAESWNGTAWSVVTAPGRGKDIDELNGVSCTAADSCVAAGYSFDPGAAQTLVEAWDGTNWAIVTSPNPGNKVTTNVLNGVSCATATTCMAAGTTDHQKQKTLTELGS